MMREIFFLIYGFPVHILVISAIGISVLWELLAMTILKKYKIILSYILCSCYLFIVLYFTILMRENGSVREVELIPLYSIANWNIYKEEVFLNVLLFYPLGVFLSCLIGNSMRKRCFVVVLAATVSSVSIEIMQYVYGRGKAETDDVIFNVFGAVLGVFVCSAIQKIIRRKRKKEI